MITIQNVMQYAGGLDNACAYIHSKWGNKDNYAFYYDAMQHSGRTELPLPHFYLVLDDKDIIGCYALITNDFISRHDLYPWFACLYVEPDHRGKELGKLMMEHALKEARDKGFETLYLTTDHQDYYEKYGWERMEDGYEPSGKITRIYRRNT
jgi:N-acetylglutamate synthase-like GNAT family acetyltransferase